MPLASLLDTTRFNGVFTKSNLVNGSLLLAIGSLPWSPKLNTLLIGLLVAVSVFLLYFHRSFSRQDVRTFLIGATIFLVSALWLINTENLPEGFYYLERTSSGIIFPVVFLIIPSSLIRRNLVLKGFAISVLARYVYFLFTVVEFELVFITDYWLELLLQLNQLSKEADLHPTYFSIFLGFSALWSVYSYHKTKEYFWLFLFGALTICNISLAAKMPLLAFFLILFVFWFRAIFKMRNGKKKIKEIGLIVIIVGCLVFALIKVPNYMLQDFYNYYNLLNKEKRDLAFDFEKLGNKTDYETWQKTNRLFIWSATVDAIKKDMWFGVGAGDVNDALNNSFLNKGFDYHQKKNTNTHSQILDYILRFGVIGTSIILISFFLIFKKIKNENALLYGIFMFFFVCSFLTENLLNRQLGIVFFHFFSNFFLTESICGKGRKEIER